jgi:hypothetical protein
MSDPQRHRLELRCPNGVPEQATIHLDGEPLTWVTRVELVLDCNSREVTAKLTAPGALIDMDVDVAAQVAAITGPPLSEDRQMSFPVPKVGDHVHYLSEHVGCIPASIADIGPTGALTLNAPPGTDDQMVMADIWYDPGRIVPGTWHSSHTDEQAAPTVTVNVNGVVTERQLADAVNKHFLDATRRGMPRSRQVSPRT